MGNSTHVAPKPFTVTIPANHPALFSLGGQAFHAAASDLVDRVRKAAAVALIEDPGTQALMERYHEALSAAWGPGGLLSELRARGVSELHGTDYGDPGKPLSTLLRECADEIDAKTERRPQRIEETGSAGAKAPAATQVRKPATKAKTPSLEDVRRQPGLKLPIKGGNVQASGTAKPSDLQTTEVQPERVRQKARG